MRPRHEIHQSAPSLAGCPGGGSADHRPGRILTGEDAIEYILAGATAVSVGTGNLLDPSATMHVLDGIEQYLVENNIQDIRELIGQAWKQAG